VCDGSSLSTTTYSRLFAEIGYIWGGSGASFNLPNLSDRFFRGKDSGAGRDSGGDRNIGSFQNSLVKRPSAMAVDNIGHSHFSNNNYWAGSGNSTVTTRNLLGTTVTSGGATLNDHTNITSTDTVLLPNCRPVKFIIKF
jgi:microcystin-dependent protein